MCYDEVGVVCVVMRLVWCVFRIVVVLWVGCVLEYAGGMRCDMSDVCVGMKVVL